MIAFQAPQNLTNLQQELLRVFSMNLSDLELQKIRLYISQVLLERAHDAADQMWEERGYTQETMEEWLQNHDRTPYHSNLPLAPESFRNQQ